MKAATHRGSPVRRALLATQAAPLAGRRARPATRRRAKAVAAPVAAAMLAAALAACGAAGSGSSAPSALPPHRAVPVGSTSRPSSALPTTAVPAPSLYGNARPTLAPGAPGKLDVVQVGAPGGLLGESVPVLVWNGTPHTVNNVDVSGPALVGSTVVGSGDSQGVAPQNLGPGEVGFGFVYFNSAPPAGATFHFTASATQGRSNYFLDARVDQANYQPPSGAADAEVVGTVTNTRSAVLHGPVFVEVACFSGSTLTDVEDGFLSGPTDLAAGATGSFAVTIASGRPCPTYLVGASGFGAYG